MSRKTRFLAVFLLLALLAVGVVGSAAAEGDGAGVDHGPVVLTGHVLGKNLDAGTFRLLTDGWRIVQVHTSNHTTFLIQGVPDPGLDDLRLGDRVWVGGARTDQNKVAAQFVVKPPDAARALRGEIQAKIGTTLIVATPGGPISLLTNAETHFFVPGRPDASLADFTRGDHILAAGFPTPVDDTLLGFAVVKVGP